MFSFNLTPFILHFVVAIYFAHQAYLLYSGYRWHKRFKKKSLLARKLILLSKEYHLINEQARQGTGKEEGVLFLREQRESIIALLLDFKKLKKKAAPYSKEHTMIQHLQKEVSLSYSENYLLEIDLQKQGEETIIF